MRHFICIKAELFKARRNLDRVLDRRENMFLSGCIDIDDKIFDALSDRADS